MEKTTVVPVKKSWQSKTNWVSLIMAASAFFPKVGEWVASHPEQFMWAISGLFAALRMISKGKIEIK